MKSQFRGMFIAALAVTVVWTLSVLGVFRIADALLYDQLVGLNRWQKKPTTQVLIIEAGAKQNKLDGEAWFNLLQNLEALGATQILFTRFPVEADMRFYNKARHSGKVIFGRLAERAYPKAGVLNLEKRPVMVGSDKQHLAISSLPPSYYGIHRRGATVVRVGQEYLPTLEVVAAQQRGVLAETAPTKSYLINFNYGRHWLPKVSLERVLANGLIPELVSGRSVLVGHATEFAQVGIHTPVTYGSEPMSLTEFQAYALQTLIAGASIRTLSYWITLALLGLVALVSLLLYQWLNIRSGVWFTTFALLIYVVVAWMLLHYALIWIPLTEIVCTQILLFALFIAFKLVLDERALRRLLLGSAAQLRQRSVPAGFYSLSEPWGQVITLVDQIFNLTRVIFLEKIEGDHRVREVKALRCSLEDIDERRRDYERTPYSTAIKEGAPIVLEKNYLKENSGVNEQQYMVPLVFGGQVQGFWVFGIDPANIHTSERFLSGIRDFGGEIAELLFHKHQWLKQRIVESGVVSRLLRLEGGRVIRHEVQQTVGLLERRLATLETVFDGLSTATVLYDLFGRVIQVSRRMEEFARNAHLPVYKLTALDLLIRLCDIDSQQARSLLQQVVLERHELRLLVKTPSESSDSFWVNVRPLARRSGLDSVTDEATPFELLGILFELVDMTQMKRMFALKEQLVERLSYQLRNDMEALLIASHLLTQESITTHQKQQCVDILRDKISATIPKFDELQRYLQQDLSKAEPLAYPVDAQLPLLAALKRVESQAKLRYITFAAVIPEVTCLVLAHLSEMEFLFVAVFEALIRDAAEESTIEVKLEQRDGWMHYGFKDVGFGLPNERLQAYLFDPQHSRASEFRSLHDAMQPVSSWGGRVRVHSEIGVGIHFSLHLKVVI